MLQTDASIPGIQIQEMNSAGKITLGQSAGAPSSTATTASKFAVGCILTDSNTGIAYVMNGTVAAPTWRPQAGPSVVQNVSASIATTGNTDNYAIVPEAGVLASIDFSSLAALAAHDSNYITWTVTNLGQGGAGSTAMLAATDANTTKATGGTALSANTKRSLTLNSTSANLVVAAGDRLLIRAAATGTLAGAVTVPVYLLRFTPSAQV